MCRSAPPQPVLELVDQVFANPTAARRRGGAGRDADPLRRPCATMPAWSSCGRSHQLPDATEPLPWSVPDAEPRPDLGAAATGGDPGAVDRRARSAATVMLESRGRPLAPGDVMVLVRRRNDFGRALVRALKSLGVPVAGLDRLMLTEQPAVQDLMALADALLLPQDDLTFACLLTSPLGGLSDDSLDGSGDRARAALVGGAARAGRTSGRTGRRPGRSSRHCWLGSIMSRRTPCSPRRSGRSAGGRGCMRRLGPEAAEPVDELLNAALAYCRMHPPSLQGFLHWLRRSGAEVKRESEAAGSLVRVMTVHGAKGLQAPLVILPDTTSLPPDEGPILWATDPATKRDVPIWSPRRGAALRGGPAPARRGEARAGRRNTTGCSMSP